MTRSRSAPQDMRHESPPLRSAPLRDRHTSLLCVVLCGVQWSRLARSHGIAHEELHTAEEGGGAS